MAYWLVQSNLINQEDYIEIVKAMKACKAKWRSVKCKPFSKEVLRLPDKYRELPICILGSVNLSKWGKEKSLPGVWWNDNFNFVVQKSIYKEHMLNYDSIVCRLGDVEPYKGERFIRPVDDGKAFTGEIIDNNCFVEWQERIQQFNTDDQVNPSTMVMVSSVKDIYREYRFFIVDGKVVTGSLYNEDDRRIRREVDFTDVDMAVTNFVNDRIKEWVPDRVFVIDIAVLRNGDTKVIEINNANGSGFYKCNIGEFIRAVDKIL